LIRAKALQKLSERSIPIHSPLSRLQEILPPVFLWHRYEVEAVVKLIGGVTYQYTMRGDLYEKQQLLKPVSGFQQRRAVSQLLLALEPSQLAVPQNLIPYILPQAFGYEPALGGSSDIFQSRIGVLFDRLAPSEAAANLVISSVFNPQVFVSRYGSCYHLFIISLLSLMIFCTYAFLAGPHGKACRIGYCNTFCYDLFEYFLDDKRIK
jgi:hypothetical protein